VTDSPLHSSWNSIDPSEERVPVRGAVEPQELPVRRTASVRVQSLDAGHMHLAALTGIGIVLALGTIFYFGTDSLRGSLTDGVSTVNINITEEGTFDPSEVTVQPGDTLVITNDNPDPQVLKSSGTSDLFVTQLLFDEPFSFEVPPSALGKTFTYMSETLPETESLTIVVGNPATTTTQSSEPQDSIPLPTESSSSEETVSASSESSSESSSVSSASSIPVIQASTPRTGQPLVVTLISSSIPASTVHNTGSPTSFSLKPAGTAQSSSSLPSISGNSEKLPSNPYTIGNRQEAERLGLLPKKSSSSSSASSTSLHAGANLRRITEPVRQQTTVTKKPAKNVETGPGPVLLIVTMLALGMMTLSFQSSTRALRA
jgi:hypothetical protein